MYAGHGSWAFAIVIVAMLAARMLSSRRGYGRGRGPDGSTRQPGPVGMPWLQGRPRPDRPIDVRSEPHGSPVSGARGHIGIEAGWMPDPSGRFEERYWSGTAWTEHVRSGGTPSTDQPPGTTGPVGPAS